MISPEKIKELEERLRALGIAEADIVEKFVHAGGHGGQKVNKTSSCVYLKHTPTGIEVKCQQERSQAMNRFFARRLLADKVEALRHPERAKDHDRIRKQKHKRARRARAKAVPSDQSAPENT